VTDARIGRVLQGRYRIVDRLAVGGMGVVYRGERIGLDRPVAIKFLRTPQAAKKEGLRRFDREARAMSRLAHPNCVPVIDYGVDEEAPYIVLEFVEGPALDEVLAEGPLPAPRAIRIVRQILAGLAHAHDQGIVHRDMKPGNVMLARVTGSGEQARILDFGLAKLLEPSESASWSTTSVAVGTPGYMSPEQARGEEVDRRTDLYSTGILLFELLTGRKPFVAEEPMQVLRMHVEQVPPTLAEAASGRSFSRELQAAVSGALTKDPATRWQTALAFADALAATPEGQVEGDDYQPMIVESTRPPRPRDDAEPIDPAAVLEEVRAERRARRGTLPYLLASIAVLAVLAAAGWFYLRHRDAMRDPPARPAVTVDAAVPVPAPPDAAAGLAPRIPDAAPPVLPPDASPPEPPPDASLPDASPSPPDAPLPSPSPLPPPPSPTP